MRAFVAVTAGVTLVACAPARVEAGVPPDGVGARMPHEDPCGARRVRNLVGRLGTSALARTARERSGAVAVRYRRPGEIVTMEFRSDRLNLILDTTGRIVRIDCG